MGALPGTTCGCDHFAAVTGRRGAAGEARDFALGSRRVGHRLYCVAGMPGRVVARRQGGNAVRVVVWAWGVCVSSVLVPPRAPLYGPC